MLSVLRVITSSTLNESPSEKEGKYNVSLWVCGEHLPSMKVPPKRKGNLKLWWMLRSRASLNESPSEKEGKYSTPEDILKLEPALNESPSEKEGKFGHLQARLQTRCPQ